MSSEWKGWAIYGGKKDEYRYVLGRDFETFNVKGTCVFIMLNPSTATEHVSDPTVRRCELFANERLGYDRLVVLNIFALRSTDPKALYVHKDPIGPENDAYILQWAGKADALICAWGVHGEHLGRAGMVKRRLIGRSPRCLGLTKGGHPRHPLYLKKDAPLLSLDV